MGIATTLVDEEERMARVPLIARREEMPPEGRAAWDTIAETRRHVIGPFQALLHSPELATRIGHLGAHIRFQSPLPPAVRELVILSVARAMDCRFEWGAHVPIARQAGVSEEAISAVRDRRAPAGLTADEAAIVTYATDLLKKHRVGEEAFAAVRDRLGVAGTVELTAAVGYYSMIACTLNAFEIVPDGGVDALPV